MPAKSFHLQVIGLPVTDVAQSVAWYRDMFQLGFCFPYNEGDDEAWLNLNGMGFGLIRSPEIPKLEFPNMRGERMLVLSFQVDNIHELREEMLRKGADVGEMVYKRGGGYSFRFADPDGNPLSVWGGWPTEEDERANA